MFYPALKRQPVYDQKQDGSYYANYSHYREAITIDCKHRCVYCDIKLVEHGGEGFHLDHFRPQHLFENLKTSPLNLVLACPKCNILKSKHWPLDVNTSTTKSHDGQVGFIDPFLENQLSYYSVESSGKLKVVQEPGQWNIDLLQLNRPSRVEIRRSRILRQRIDDIMGRVSALLNEALVAIEQTPEDKQSLAAKISLALELNNKLAKILSNLENL